MALHWSSDDACARTASMMARAWLAHRRADALAKRASVVTLRGPLGAGKTTFTRAWLRALGVQGTIKSPTYALVEPYECSAGAIAHMDLYRLTSSRDIEDAGLLEALSTDALVLVEWPEHAGSLFDASDLDVVIRVSADTVGRDVEVHAKTPAGMAAQAPCA